MASLTGTFQLGVDAAIRGTLGAVKTLARRRVASPVPGAPLPGGHTHFEIEVVERDDESYLRIGDTHRSLWRTVEWRLMSPVCRALPAPVLDLGCGDGAFGARVRDRIDHGMDGDERALAHCDRSVYAEVSFADIREELPAAEGTFASAFSNSTLEHVVPVERAFESVGRVLKPGGEFLFTVPTIELSRAFTRRYGTRYCDHLNDMFGHHNLWPWSEWKSRLEASGYTDVSMQGYLTHEAMIWFASRHLEPWEQLSRRANDWVWRRDLPAFLRLCRESVEATEERDTTCVLVRARRP